MQLRGGIFSADFLEYFAVSFMHDAEMGECSSRKYSHANQPNLSSLPF